MTWQEELRQLDSALARGEVAANEYRKRRDEILAAASSAQPPSDIIGPPTGPQPAVSADGDNAEVTQVVNAHDTELVNETDKTQVISGIDAESTRELNPSERTQTITTTTPATRAPKNQMAWTAQPPASTAAFGPPRPQMQPAPVTPRDAQNLFGDARPPRKNKIWLMVVAIVVVLAAAGGAVWYFGLRDDTPTAEQPTENTTENTTPTPPPVNLADIDLPGEPGNNNGEMDIAEARTAKVLAEQEATMLEEAGITTVEHSGSSDGDYHFLLYAYPSADADAARATTETVSGLQEQLGLLPAQIADVPEGVEVTQLANARAAVLRGLYTYGDTTIQLCVLQIPAGGAEELQEQFRLALESVVAAAPPAR